MSGNKARPSLAASKSDLIGRLSTDDAALLDAHLTGWSDTERLLDRQTGQAVSRLLVGAVFGLSACAAAGVLLLVPQVWPHGREVVQASSVPPAPVVAAVPEKAPASQASASQALAEPGGDHGEGGGRAVADAPSAGPALPPVATAGVPPGASEPATAAEPPAAAEPAVTAADPSATAEEAAPNPGEPASRTGEAPGSAVMPGVALAEPSPVQGVAPPVPGLLLVARQGDTLQRLYRSVYSGVRAPPFQEVAEANPTPVRPGVVLVFPTPPDGWRRP